MEKTWVIKDVDQYFYRMGVRRATQGLPFADEKNPASAYTLSLFFWGAGQSYSGHRWKSILFQILMFLFLSVVVLSLLYGKELVGLLLSYGVSRSDAFLAAQLLLFAALCFWLYNARDAYHAAARARRVPFRGVRNRALPMLSSLLIPGWGQFMNGQPVKGGMLTCFSILGIFSLLTVPAVLLVWPALEPSPTRATIEAIFAAAALYAPLVPVIWLLSGYDALIVSLDDTKKETLLDRLGLAANRIRVQGLLRTMVPSVRSLVVSALLAGLLFAVNELYRSPGSYFSGSLAGAQAWMQKQGMTMVPDLIGRLLSLSGTVLAGK